MAFLAINRAGYDDFKRLGLSGVALWVAFGVLNSEELESLRKHTEVTDFAFEINPTDFTSLAGAIQTIRDHHPNESVWVGM